MLQPPGAEKRRSVGIYGMAIVESSLRGAYATDFIVGLCTLWFLGAAMAFMTRWVPAWLVRTRWTNTPSPAT